jgi:hypothetical protein
MVKLTISLMSHHPPQYLGNPLAVQNHDQAYNSITVLSYHQPQYLGNPLEMQNHGIDYTYNSTYSLPSTTISWQSFGNAKSW